MTIRERAHKVVKDWADESNPSRDDTDDLVERIVGEMRTVYEDAIHLYDPGPRGLGLGVPSRR